MKRRSDCSSFRGKGGRCLAGQPILEATWIAFSDDERKEFPDDPRRPRHRAADFASRRCGADEGARVGRSPRRRALRG
eukprot:6578190-Pyramimonas_sp.AAC.1